MDTAVKNTAAGGQPGKRRRSRQAAGRRWSAGGAPNNRLLLAGAALSVAFSVILAFFLLGGSGRPLFSPDLDVTALNASLRAALAGQSAAINTLVMHVRRAQSTGGARRLQFLALGPRGTGKTLLTQTLASAAAGGDLGGGVRARRLVGGEEEVSRDLSALDRLAARLAAAVPAGGWLLLAFDDVSEHLPHVVYLTEAVAAAVAASSVRLLTVLTASTPDVAGERGAAAEREAFAHAVRLPFRPLRRRQVGECVRLAAAGRGVPLPEAETERLVESVRFEGLYAVDGCKPAIYKLQALYNLTAV